MNAHVCVSVCTMSEGKVGEQKGCYNSNVDKVALHSESLTISASTVW